MGERVRLTLEYDGTAYCGWQRQDNALAVQQVLEEALQNLEQQPVTCVGASRTDAGVHALGQVVHFDSRGRIPGNRFLNALGPHLPQDIVCVASEAVSEDFSARFDSRGKRYVYRILNRHAPSALRSRFVWHLRDALDQTSMQAAAQQLLGEHDFSSFQGAGCTAKTTRRKLTRVDVSQDSDEIVVVVEGDAFLRYMVRNLVGTLVGVGKGDIAVDAITGIVEAADRRAAGMTAPARGLVLERVYY